MKIPIEIKKIIKKAKCPECGKQLICGGWQSYFKYVELSNLDAGYQIGKDDSDGLSLLCEINNHNTTGVLTSEENDKLNDFLNEI